MIALAAGATSTTSAVMMSTSATHSCCPGVFFPTTLQVDLKRIASSFLKASNARPRSLASLSSSAAVNATMAIEPSAKILDGKSLARIIREEIRAEISRMKESTGVNPGLGVIVVGDGDTLDLMIYPVSMRIECESVGIKLHEMRLSEGCSQQELLKHISSFNDNPSINGIITGTPLPSHMNEEEVLNAIRVEKDVEGSNFLNISRLAMKDRQPLFVPCMSKGCIELLHKYGVAINGKRAVVIGRGTVGMPTAILLQREDATVTVVHSSTRNLEEITREADILICAVGQPNMVRGSWIKSGAIVIDVGSNFIELDEEDPLNYEIVGDVCYEEASKIASAITSTYLDVEEMAATMFLSNILDAAKRAHNFE